MRAKVILNPYADNGRGRQCQALIETAAQPYGGIEIALTEYPGHGRELARQFANEGYDLVAAAGGDGTISDVVNGLVLGDKATTRLGIIPIGSGNDLAWSLGISSDVGTAVRTLFTGQPRTLDLARVEDDHGRYRIFDNNMGIGFDATIVVEAENITRVHGFAMYLLATLRTIAFYYDKPLLEMQFDDERLTQESLFLAFGVGPRGGGGFLLTPNARHDDNLIDTCLVSPVGRLTMLLMLLKVKKGTHGSHKAIALRQNRRITVRADRPVPIHTDGEVFAYTKDNVRQVTVTSLPAAIDVMVGGD
ncbi:MAG: diacylglycerol kinase family lipid kinase [Anaerolineae bacterium]|nr:diacylglycerol kinase family lipid kinase [Anaerolineae bacterium]